MTIEANNKVVRRYYQDAINAGNLDALDELAVSPYDEHDPCRVKPTGAKGSGSGGRCCVTPSMRSLPSKIS